MSCKVANNHPSIISSTLPRRAKIPPKANCLAKALFDNIAETPDELAFRKGDILTVLEQNTNGLEGWWLCSLRGRQGIVPGNRLRLLAGMYEDPLSSGSNASNIGTFPGRGNNHAIQTRRRSWHINPTKVVTPQKIGDVYCYDVPRSDGSPASRLEQSSSFDAYDIPPSANSRSPHKLDSSGSHSLDNSQVMYDMPPDAFSSSPYDVPRAYHEYDVPAREDQEYDTPRSNRLIEDAKSHTYDVPDSGVDVAYDVPISHLHIDDKMVDYDVPPSRQFGSIYSTPPSQNLSKRCSGMSLNSTGSSATNSSSSSGISAMQMAPSSPTTLSNRSSLNQSHDLYDIPQSELRKVVPASDAISSLVNVQQELYDVPTNNAPANINTSRTELSEGVYDVPPQVTRDVSLPKKEFYSDHRLSSSSLESVTMIDGKELPLELDAAMDTLVRIQQQVHTAITKLFSHVTSTWRKKEGVDSNVYDIKQACLQARTVLQEFVNFAQGALVNSTHASDKTLSKKLAKLIKPLLDANEIIQKAGQSLEDCGWQIYKQEDSSSLSTPDELDQFIACSRSVNDDVRQIASFIQGNCTLLFRRSEVITSGVQTSSPRPKILPKPSSLRKKTSDEKSSVQNRPLPLPPSQKIETAEQPLDDDDKDWANEYDYVSMESKEVIEKENKEIKAVLPQEMEKSFENLVKESQIPIEDVSTITTNLKAHEISDQLVIKFYFGQVDKHMQYLTNAIDAFLLTVENNQPPKVFVAHTKFLILAAHKIVYVGDTMQRNIDYESLKKSIAQCTNNLCDTLKHVVICTKKAAAQFPSVTAVQAMVDSVVDVSNIANNLKLVISQAAIP